MRSLLSVLCLLLGATLAAQPTPFAELERQLRDPSLDFITRARVVDALLETGPRGARVIARGIAAAAQSELRALETDRRSAVRRFDKIARTAVQRGSRGHAPEIEQLRDELAALRSSPSLSEQRILATADPAVARLRALLAITVEGAIAADEELAALVERVERHLDVLADLRASWELAADELRAAEGGEDLLDPAKAPPDVEPLASAFRAELELSARLATPVSPSGEAILRENEALSRELEPTVADGIRVLNHLRVLLDLAPLRIDPKLCAAAADHSADMERLEFFSHTSPVPGKRTPSERAARFGTSGGAENIARGHSTGPGAIRGWWYSPGHHRNMLGGHGRVGLGRSGSFWTQMFGG